MKEKDVIKTENLALKRENARLGIVIDELLIILLNQINSKSSIQIDQLIHDDKVNNTSNNHQS
ncbi:hypothetical protein BOVMAS28_11550 [Streptococcus uberis]